MSPPFKGKAGALLDNNPAFNIPRIILAIWAVITLWVFDVSVNLGSDPCHRVRWNLQSSQVRLYG